VSCATPRPHHSEVIYMVRDSWNIRIYSFIKEYYQKKGINPREILEQKYYELKNNELPELLKEKEKLQQRVAQIDEIVTQLNTKNDKIEVDQLTKDYETFIQIIKNWETIKPFYIKQHLPNGSNLTDKQLLQIRNNVLKDKFSINEFKKLVGE